MSHLPAREGMPQNMRSRRPRLARTRILVAMLMLGITTLVGAAPAAQADEEVLPDLACTVNFQLTFTPALTATNTTAAMVGQAGLVNCFSPSGAYPDIRSGTANGPGTVTSIGGVPCNLLLTANGTAKFVWNTGEVSDFNYVVNTNPLAGEVTLHAQVTSGPLAGTTATAVPVLANPNPDCLFVGLTNLTSALSEVVYS